MGFFTRHRPVVLRNVNVVGPDGLMADSLRIEQRQVSGASWGGGCSRRGDVVVDMHSAFVFPGLINAHDHLEHNHFGRVKSRDRYENASQWADDMGPRLSNDPAILLGKSRPLADRLFIGGVKNLLSGATTVAHHNPLYRELDRAFPVRVVREYGWAHSLYLEGGRAGARGESAGNVADRHRETPPTWPFIIHLAEGSDEGARAELKSLQNLNSLGPSTVLVHGVGIDQAGWREVARSSAGVVWCPASNLFLLGETISGKHLADRASPQVALGTDSRLTGSRDLLDELRVAAQNGPFKAAELVRKVTTTAASLLRLRRAGRIAVGLPADLLIIPHLAEDPHDALLLAERRDVLLVMIDGKPRYGAPELAEIFTACDVASFPVTVDGDERLLAAKVVDRLRVCSISEPGVSIPG
jgi:cytosine/adenosine deaminase-related metal-dependent hydrolase